MAAVAVAAGAKGKTHYPTVVTTPTQEWLVSKGLIDYFDIVYPLFIRFFTTITRQLEESESRPLRMIAVGSFAKHLYESTFYFGDFDFQVYELDIESNYLSQSFRDYVSDVITPEMETDIKEYLLTFIKPFISETNEITATRKPELPFRLIINETDTSSPPGPLKISIQYGEGYDASPIKIVDINYSKQNVLAYNKIGLEIIKKFDGNIPIKEITFRDYGGFIKTLQPCVFYEEKKILSGINDTGIPKDKLKNDLKFWKYHCKGFITKYGGGYVPSHSRSIRTKNSSTRKSKKSLRKRTRKNHQRSK
jgi:hypothetical protein